MDYLGAFGFSRNKSRPVLSDPTELVMTQRPLNHILSHVGYSIDDVVDNPIAKHAVLGYYKLDRQIKRRCEIVDLERQWNPI